ncbi:hypothetical protein BLOT_008965 [Blomia tropicalis]|nr:hypothetical protein BLOT_008965 [Blomia tropicalis]
MPLASNDIRNHRVQIIDNSQLIGMFIQAWLGIVEYFAYIVEYDSGSMPYLVFYGDDRSLDWIVPFKSIL